MKQQNTFRLKMTPASTGNHYVHPLITTLDNQPVLLAHKDYPLVYWGWYRMAQAAPDGILHRLLLSAANWVFSGP